MVFPAVSGRLGNGGQTMNTVPGNYLEHAVEGFVTLEPIMRKHCNPKFIDYFKDLWPIALKAPRFLLPSGGIAVNAELRHLTPPVRLPYPCTVMEFDTAEGANLILIARETETEHGALMIGISMVHRGWNECKNWWVPCEHVLFIDCSTHPITEQGAVHIRVADIDKEKSVLPEDAGADNWSINTFDCVLSLILALQCSNVGTETIPPPPTLNKKRIQNGRLPFVEYKILTIEGTRVPSEPGTGTHASPRQHLRRGHVRRLSDGRKVWVHQCLVGDPKKGTIVKDYRVRV